MAPKQTFKQVATKRNSYLTQTCPKTTGKGFLLTYISLKIWELRHSHSFIRMHGKEVARIVTIVNKHSFNLQKPYISYRRSYFTKFVPPTTAKHQTSGWFLWSLAILLPNSFEVGNFLSLHVHELTHGFKATDLERLQTLRCLRAVGRRNQTSQCKHGHPVKKICKMNTIPPFWSASRVCVENIIWITKCAMFPLFMSKIKWSEPIIQGMDLQPSL